MKRLLITGASRGIGRAIAEHLAANDVMLLLHGRDARALDDTARAVEQRGAAVSRLLFDLRESNEAAALVDAVGAEPLDGLINNAGIAVVKPLERVSLNEWQDTFAVNVTAAFILTQQLCGRMRAGASIVNVLSIAARSGFGGWSSYCASKFALEGFSQAVREELRPRGIRVINIYPAATATEIWNAVEGEWPREKMMSANEVGAAVAFALAQPSGVAVENITLTSVSGAL